MSSCSNTPGVLTGHPKRCSHNTPKLFLLGEHPIFTVYTHFICTCVTLTPYIKGPPSYLLGMIYVIVMLFCIPEWYLSPNLTWNYQLFCSQICLISSDWMAVWSSPVPQGTKRFVRCLHKDCIHYNCKSHVSVVQGYRRVDLHRLCCTSSSLNCDLYSDSILERWLLLKKQGLPSATKLCLWKN